MAATVGKLGGAGKLLRLAAAFSLVFLAACGKPVSEADFVGKWRSSRLSTPLYLYDNGEWEIKTQAGDVVQFGVWRYEKDRLVWTYKMDHSYVHDANHVLAVTPQEFRLQEADGSQTTFTRLD